MGRTASKDGACDRSRRCRPGQRRDQGHRADPGRGQGSVPEHRRGHRPFGARPPYGSGGHRNLRRGWPSRARREGGWGRRGSASARPQGAGAPGRGPRGTDHYASKGLRLRVRDCPNQLTGANWPYRSKEVTRRTLSFTPSRKFVARILRQRVRRVSGDLTQQADRTKFTRKMSCVAQRP